MLLNNVNFRDQNSFRKIVIFILISFVLLLGPLQGTGFALLDTPNPVLRQKTIIENAPHFTKVPDFSSAKIPCGKCNKGNNSISDGLLKEIKKIEGYAGLLKNTCTDSLKKDCNINGTGTYGFYNDPKGYCTTGYGHLVDLKNNPPLNCEAVDKLNSTDPVRKEKDSLANTIKNQNDAEKLLKKDVKVREEEINKNIKVCLYQNEFDALFDFHFNTGKIASSKLPVPTLINNGNFTGATEVIRHYSDGKNPSLVSRMGQDATNFAGCRP